MFLNVNGWNNSDPGIWGLEINMKNDNNIGLVYIAGFIVTQVHWDSMFFKWSFKILSVSCVLLLASSWGSSTLAYFGM